MRQRVLPALVSVLLWSAACGPGIADFQTFMEVPLPPGVTVTKLNGNWGNDPWRCFEISPVNEELKRQLIARWQLMPDARAFHGVASGNKIYCQFDNLSESYSGYSNSYRAVGVDAQRSRLLVYFYNG